MGLLWDLRRSFQEGTRERKNVIGRDRRFSYAPFDTPVNNDAVFFNILLSLLFIANFTPPESSQHSARLVITAGNNVSGPSCTVVRKYRCQKEHEFTVYGLFSTCIVVQAISSISSSGIEIVNSYGVLAMPVGNDW